MEVTAIQNIRKFIVTATSTPRQYKVVIATLGKRGLPGKSAYQIAQENGYNGTEEEFGDLLTSISKKENKLNWWTLLVSASAKVLLTNNEAGKLYKYTYGTIDLYRFIKADKIEDSFYAEEEKTTLIATRFNSINI